MATASELHSLDDIRYKSKIRPIFWFLFTPFLFVVTFLNTYPIGVLVKDQMKKQLAGSACRPDFDDIRIEWLLPKIVISDLSIPASCFNKQGETIKLSHVTVNYHFINFSPLGLPFKIDTEISGQPLSLYFVQGPSDQLIRLKDQNLVLGRLEALLGSFKMNGSVMTDLTLSLSNRQIKTLEFKAVSKDFHIPNQQINDFGLPNLKLKKLYVEASGTYPRLTIEKFILGDESSPLRANLRGRIDMQEGGFAFSPIQLDGELFLSEQLKETAGWLELLVQSFPQKDGFYQVRLGGTLSSPKPMAQ